MGGVDHIHVQSIHCNAKGDQRSAATSMGPRNAFDLASMADISPDDIQGGEGLLEDAEGQASSQDVFCWIWK